MSNKKFSDFHKEKLLETPIGDYTTIGDWSKNSSFRDKRDRMLIQNPRSIEMVRKKFDNTEIMFNFYFVNSPAANKVTEEGLVSLDWVKDRLGDEVYNAVDKNIGDDSINVVFTNNKGAERKNMSAWIMAHRIGHALARRGGSRESYPYKEASNHLISTFSQCMEYYGNEDFPSTEDRLIGRGIGRHVARRNQLAMLAFFYEVGGFRSARERNIRDWFEVLNELIAQYLTTGKIKFRPAPRSFGQRGGTNRFSFSTDDTESVDEILDTLSRDMEYYIDAALGSVMNGVLVM